MIRLTTGDPAPMFIAPSQENPTFRFTTLAGRWVALAFAPDLETVQRYRAAMATRPDLLDDNRVVLFSVLREGYSDAFGPRCFADPDGAVAASYGADHAPLGAARPHLADIRPGSARRSVEAAGPAQRPAAPRRACRGPVERPGADRPPRVRARLLPGADRRLQGRGGEESGFMREVDGYTRLMNDPRHKQRKDVMLEDQTMIDQARERIRRRLVPRSRRRSSSR
jgi:hypothetical protein